MIDELQLIVIYKGRTRLNVSLNIGEAFRVVSEAEGHLKFEKVFAWVPCLRHQNVRHTFNRDRQGPVIPTKCPICEGVAYRANREDP